MMCEPEFEQLPKNWAWRAGHFLQSAELGNGPIKGRRTIGLRRCRGYCRWRGPGRPLHAWLRRRRAEAGHFREIGPNVVVGGVESAETLGIGGNGRPIISGPNLVNCRWLPLRSPARRGVVGAAIRADHELGALSAGHYSHAILVLRQCQPLFIDIGADKRESLWQSWYQIVCRLNVLQKNRNLVMGLGPRGAQHTGLRSSGCMALHGAAGCGLSFYVSAARYGNFTVKTFGRRLSKVMCATALPFGGTRTVT